MNLALANRPRLIQPGLPRFEPGVERYRIAGGGAVVLALFAGDRLEITDLEGRQRAELVVFAPAGHEDAAALGLRAEGAALDINRLLAGRDAAAQAVAASLRARGLPRGIAKAVDLFQHDSLPGETIGAVAARDVIAIIHASGAVMGVEGELPPTDIVAVVRRANPLIQETPPLPEPLAEPKFERHIERATGQAFEVKEGEYIQIIDVAGRQCSDFLAFNQRALDKGNVLGLDSTTTRTMLGLAYPKPGLFSKFFDRDRNALVEVVQDTVGRHDTFNLACTARYYEDMGY